MEAERTSPSDWLLAALIFAVPLMKPAVHEPIIAADILFLLLAGCVALEVLAGRRRLCWLPGYAALLAYLLALGASLLATSNFAGSLFKYATEFYLVGLAAITGLIADSEAKLRRAVLAWLTGTAVTCLVGILGLAAFATGTMSWLLDYSSFGFGSLPPGDYPRLSLTFFNANMACNYLTGSLALLLIAGNARYLGRAAWWSLLAGIAIASLSTISAGLGGIALLAGAWIWLVRKDSAALRWAAMLAGVSVAVLFVVALSVTVVSYAAPFAIHLPGGITLYASGRVMIWTAAVEQFARHPLLGVGIGVPPVDVHYPNPSGYVEDLADAHNVFLSIAAQTGIVGLIGLAALLAFVARHSRGTLRTVVLGITVLDVLAYQGLGGSFEDTRHIWLLIGLFIAARRLDVSRADGSSRRAGAPSRC
jgi:putative inorganic carbon (hco3(-)) transporter